MWQRLCDQSTVTIDLHVKGRTGLRLWLTASASESSRWGLVHRHSPMASVNPAAGRNIIGTIFLESFLVTGSEAWKTSFPVDPAILLLESGVNCKLALAIYFYKD